MNPDEPKPQPGPSPLKQIRTFQGDVAEALRNQNESLVSIQRAEVKRDTRPSEPPKKVEPPVEKANFLKPVTITPSAARTAPEEPRKPITVEQAEEKQNIKSGILLFLGTILLIGLGGYGAWYGYELYTAKISVPIATEFDNKFLSTDSFVDHDALTLNRDSLIQLVQAELLKNSGKGIEQIELHKGAAENPPLLPTESFLALLQSHAPGNLVRALDPLFMLGTIGAGPKSSFILIKLDSFENAYDGMLKWEINMADDLLPLFAPEAVVQSVPSNTTFSDVTIQNKDARILKDPNGNTVLLYSFYDNQILVITDTEETLRTLITRLNSEKLTR